MDRGSRLNGVQNAKHKYYATLTYCCCCPVLTGHLAHLARAIVTVDTQLIIHLHFTSLHCQSPYSLRFLAFSRKGSRCTIEPATSTSSPSTRPALANCFRFLLLQQKLSIPRSHHLQHFHHHHHPQLLTHPYHSFIGSPVCLFTTRTSRSGASAHTSLPMLY